MSGALVYWDGDAYVFDADGELVSVHNVGDGATMARDGRDA